MDKTDNCHLDKILESLENSTIAWFSSAIMKYIIFVVGRGHMDITIYEYKLLALILL